MKRLLISLAMVVFPHLVAAQTIARTDILPYGAYLNYKNTTAKEYSFAPGIYSYFGYGMHHSFEGDFSFTRINYGEEIETVGFRRSISRPINIDQFNVTLVYSNYSLTDLKLRAGLYTIFSTDDQSSRSYISFGGIQRYRTYHYNAGVDVYASFYNNYIPDLKVLQLTWTFGFYFGNYFTYGSFYSETKGHYIQLSKDVGFNEKEFASIKQSLFFTRNNLTLQVFLWTGYQVFGVQKDGFIVFNLPERHLGAYGGSIKYILNKKFSFKLLVSQGRFKEVGMENIAGSLIFTLMLGYTF